MRYTIFNTDIGWVGILTSAKGLVSTTLPQPSARQARQLLGDRLNYATPSQHLSAGLVQRLQAYFSGHRVTFPERLALSGATLFQRQVWAATSLIPYGETRSYRWVAEQIGKPGAARAVGQALGKNRLPIIIPCHRVIENSGQLGGFGGGVGIKKHLLSLEAATTG